MFRQGSKFYSAQRAFFISRRALVTALWSSLSDLRPIFALLAWQLFPIKSFVKGVFELPSIEDLLCEGPGQRQIYKSRPSAFRGCPRFKMLGLRVDFRWDFAIFVYHACLFCFQLYFSAYHYWSFSLVSLWYCDFYVTLCFAWFGSVILVSSLTSVCFTPFAWFGIVVLTVRILG